MARADFLYLDKRLGIFAGAGLCAYGILAMAFTLLCVVGGHNPMEMLFGGTASYVIAVVAGIEVAIFAGARSAQVSISSSAKLQ